ncbi:MAG: tRNA uridine-5-carboxymethylaminomethyl(34) synthesis GTPase MnmE, partial [Myxococcota bacterium]
METIAAIATAVGEGGVGVIRLSGPASLSCVEKMFVRKRKGPWKPHQMVLGVCLGEDGSVLDEGLAVWMPEGRSFTGEEVVELHMHGGRLHLMQLLRRVLSLGVRLAEPGEFSKRAYFHGKMDLTQAEAVADLIAANNAQALHVARQHLQGKLRTALQELAERSLSIAMRVESWIDFPEEFDPALDASVKLIWDDLHAFAQEVRVLEESYAQGCRLREGWSLLLLGPPNAGKSSLFNALCGEQRALVTSMSGTTRDLLEVQMEWAGIQLRLVDSAGLRALSHESLDTVTHERVEQMGMERALTFAQDVQLLLVVLDRAQELTPQELEPIRQACQQKPHLLILNKSDLSTRLSKES